MRFFADDEGVTPVVATLALILVAIIGAVSIAYLVGAFSTDVSKKVTAPDATPTPAPQILIADSPRTYDLDQQLARQYMASHGGVKVTVQSAPDEFVSTTSLSQNISDIMVLPKAPDPSLSFKDPKIRAYYIGGMAVVVIANTNMNISSLSQADLSMVYSQTQKNKPINLSGLSTVVRNGNGGRSEEIFAGWLTNGEASNLDGYMITPEGVQNYTASSESDVISKVSSTPGAIGFINWRYVKNNNPSTTHVNVIPIVNVNNGFIQSPTESSIKNELINANDAYYDDGLTAGVYYLTNGQPGQFVQNYLDWCQMADRAAYFNTMGMYGASDLDLRNSPFFASEQLIQ